MPNGTFRFDFAGIFGALNNFFRSLLAFLAQAVVFLFQLAQWIFTFLFNLVIALARITFTGFRAIARGLRFFWTNYLRKLVVFLTRQAARLASLINRVVRPILRVLERINRILDRYYTKFVRPLLIWLERFRRIAQLLRLAGIKWGEKIDRLLFAIEVKIFRSFLLVRGKVNQISSLLNLLLTRDGELQPRMILQALARWVGAIAALLVNAGIPIDIDRRFLLAVAALKLPEFRRGADGFQSGEIFKRQTVAAAVRRFEQRVGVATGSST